MPKSLDLTQNAGDLLFHIKEGKSWSEDITVDVGNTKICSKILHCYNRKLTYFISSLSNLNNL